MTIYEKLGVKTRINARGTITLLGGSLMDPSVLEAMTEASKHFVDINELHKRAGEYIASLLDVEAACITCGASAGIAISTAACMAGKDKGRILQLPDTHGMKNEVLMLKSHRNLYDQAVLTAGAKIVDVGLTSFCCIESVRNTITENTCMFFYATEASTMRGSIPLRDIIALMNEYNIPVVVDAAAELPPRNNITQFLDMGASLVVFSGGKEIRGPQSSGLILGKKDLIEACDENSCPHHSIGRAMKVDKETIAGLVRAVELFCDKDYEKQLEVWDSWVEYMISKASQFKGIKCYKGYPTEPGIQPTIIPRMYVEKEGKSANEIFDELWNGTPSIKIGVESGCAAINPQCLKEDEIQIVLDSISKL